MSTDAIRLENWSVGSAGIVDPYTAPELAGISLCGYAKGHPKLGDARVTTSYVVSSKGRFVTTHSGSVYRLGRISQKYREWMKSKGIPYDPRNPVRVKSGKSCDAGEERR